jgi:DNA polymerase-3 subunit alpha
MKVFKNVYWRKHWPSIFQFGEKGIQKFGSDAKPKHVQDISAISAIWRPGPLKGMAHERYLASRPSDVKKEHPIIQEVLGDTKGILIYQEQFMLLAHKLAGFTLEEANKLRKLLVKPATSLAEEMKKERIEIGKKFVNGCVEKGLSKERATNLWKKEILGFISYGFNKSHSVSYAFISYQCAWLYTYYNKYWIKACLECDPDPERTLNTVRQLGFLTLKPDVNTSDAEHWIINEDKTCIPCLTSLKGVGITASNELVKSRPKDGFKDIHDFFFSGKTWRWSKFNKKSLDVLIKIEAFDSLNCVGPDKIFSNYKHMYESIIKNFDAIKRKKKTIQQAALETPSDDWTTTEKMIIQQKIVGFYDKGLIIKEFLSTFEDLGIEAIDEARDEKSKSRIWAVVEKAVEKRTKTKKKYLQITVSGMSEKLYLFRAWDTSKENATWSEGSVVVFSLDFSKKWGYSLSRKEGALRVSK